MTTEHLMLARALGRAEAEDHISWAVERLVEGEDTPSLRILAGLNPHFERGEVESYFRATCADLGLTPIPLHRSPRTAAAVTLSVYDEGGLSPEEVVQYISALSSEDPSDGLLKPWLYLDEDLSLLACGYGSAFYPTDALRNLRATVDLERRIYELARFRSNVPDLINWVRCDDCGVSAPPILRRRSLRFRLEAKLKGGKPDALYPHCQACQSDRVRNIGLDPKFREHWLQDNPERKDGATDAI